MKKAKPAPREVNRCERNGDPHNYVQLGGTHQPTIFCTEVRGHEDTLIFPVASWKDTIVARPIRCVHFVRKTASSDRLERPGLGAGIKPRPQESS